MRKRQIAFHLSVLFFGMLFVFLCIDSKAQTSVLDAKIKLKFSQLAVPQILEEITKKTSYYFVYQADWVKDAPRVTSPAQAVSLRNLLFHVFNDTTLGLKVINHHIVITKHQPVLRTPAQLPLDSVSFVQIDAVIQDAETHQSIPYAVVALSGTNLGAIANAEGRFCLKIPQDKLQGELRIAHIGYRSSTVKINPSLAVPIFNLRRDVISLPEIVIRNHDPKKLVGQLVKNNALNSPSSPARMLGFYREACSRNGRYYLITEGAIDIYKSPFDALSDNDQIKVVKSRKVYNPDVSDTLIMRLKAGLSSCLLLDLNKNIPDYIKPENFDYYDYHLDDITNLNDETVYVISFSQKSWIKEALYCGKLYISNKTVALVAADVELNPLYIEKTNNDFVFRNRVKVKVIPEQVRYRIEYRQIHHKYYLSHVRGDLDFKIKKRNRIFSSRYHVFFELAATNVDTLNAKRHKSKDIEDLDGVFSVNHSGYDPSFWGNQNIIEPELPIEEALILFSEKLKKGACH